jgi:hypothetical protein
LSTSSFAQNDYHITSRDDASIDSATQLTGIDYVKMDRDSNERGLAPDIGIYEFGGLRPDLAPPVNLRFLSMN